MNKYRLLASVLLALLAVTQCVLALKITWPNVLQAGAVNRILLEDVPSIMVDEFTIYVYLNETLITSYRGVSTPYTSVHLPTKLDVILPDWVPNGTYVLRVVLVYNVMGQVFKDSATRTVYVKRSILYEKVDTALRKIDMLIASLRDNMSRVYAKLDTIYAKLLETLRRINELFKRIDELEAKLNAHIDDVKHELSGRLDSVEKSIAVLSKTLVEAKSLVEKLVGSIDSLAGTLEEVKKLAEASSLTINRVHGDTERIIDELGKARDELNTLLSRLDSINTLLTEVRELSLNASLSAKHAASAADVVTRLQGDLGTILVKLSTVTDMLKGLSSKLFTLTSTLEKLSRSLGEVKTDISSIKSSVEDVKKMLSSIAEAMEKQRGGLTINMTVVESIAEEAAKREASAALEEYTRRTMVFSAGVAAGVSAAVGLTVAFIASRRF